MIGDNELNLLYLMLFERYYTHDDGLAVAEIVLRALRDGGRT